MANIKSAKKRALQSEKRRLHNASMRSMVRTSIKKVFKTIKTGDWEASMKDFQAAQKVIDRIADKGVFTKNWAARTKSRLNARVKALKAA
ncbi:30S ribosomal protein S20 [Marinospirillum sp. MEB164]|uniref:Small ribosomal subunit protein bS20 n=1 Tax=Marinospirillum alkalitolerans TaxID=3123374 RepID=A0ABW8PWW9_9GAMM